MVPTSCRAGTLHGASTWLFDKHVFLGHQSVLPQAQSMWLIKRVWGRPSGARTGCCSIMKTCISGSCSVFYFCSWPGKDGLQGVPLTLLEAIGVSTSHASFLVPSYSGFSFGPNIGFAQAQLHAWFNKIPCVYAASTSLPNPVRTDGPALFI